MDDFFRKTQCDRCGADLPARIMSWFNDQCICLNCNQKEKEIRSALPDDREYEGCGFIPESYQAERDGTCPVCGGTTKQFGVFATGITLTVPEEFRTQNYKPYTPMAGELLKNIAEVCSVCDWNQYS